MHDISFLDRDIRSVLAGDAGDLAAERALDPVVAEELKGRNPVVGDAAWAFVTRELQDAYRGQNHLRPPDSESKGGVGALTRP